MIKNFYFLILCVLAGSIAKGQDNEVQSPDDSVGFWYTGISIEPAFVADINVLSSNDFTYMGNVKIGRQLTERFIIETGISSYHASLSWGNWGIGGYTNRYTFTGKYVDVPLTLKYLLRKQQPANPKLYIGAGVINSFSLETVNKKEVLIPPDDKEVWSTSVIRDNNFKYQQTFFETNFGTMFGLSKHLEIVAGMDLRFSIPGVIRTWTSGWYFSNYTMLLGLDVGINYKF